ncbi:RNA polymerase sigma factor [Pandoraea apista]|uniref:RNA polymerase sigma 70 n=1 Tax=Pandoraea apista TaxID=93218 RepID=A0A0B5FIC9_9BURK|nr:RNA polymerase sigma factor [Pandoraea apista]AJF00492.1 RNA polymerase sigma 70 [Pandoraea apista]AKH74680.1 RNA polymerase sigma 70 [Pandoraea apista]AKI61791.1 RNA polymerase sigma 70 [Pandoraea apista]ALS65086.1 RNA polymerase subunit sigma-70 [Pandoraea apista]AVF40052.1 RNA polymerase sigma factor [Pandoraea apista]
MADSARATLRELLVQRYGQLKTLLSRKLGSSDLAGDALQDTWVRLESTENIEPVRNPGAYLYRMAYHAAIDKQRAEDRRLSVGEIETMLDLVSPDPGPAQIAEANSDLNELVRVLEKMPQRRRDILLAVRLDGLAQREVAERFGISLRLVELELKRAQAFCAEHIERK